MSEPLDLSRCRVLLVDDDRSSLDVLIETLQGHHLLSLALDGDAALRIVAQSPPDLVVLDLIMPGLDGYQVCRRLREAPATRDLPVLFHSALRDARSKASGFEAGGTDFITKPFEAVELVARVRSLLTGKLYRDMLRARLAGELRMVRWAASALEAAGRSRRGPLDELLAAVDAEVRVVLASLAPLGGPAPCTSDRNPQTASLLVLAGCLASGELAAVTEALAMLDPAGGEELTRLRALIAGHQYERAAALIAEIT